MSRPLASDVPHDRIDSADGWYRANNQVYCKEFISRDSEKMKDCKA